jgi:3-hydroxyisobutyrate dehydrogenase
MIGMGNVGEAVLKNFLREGINVCAISDIDQSRCAGYPSSIKVAKTNREVAEMSDVIVSSLPKPPHVRQAFEGSDGILAGLSEGKVWIDHSTTDYKQSKEMEKACENVGVKLLEAPITGGIEALKKGQMTVWVGGDRATFEKVLPILNASYCYSTYTGDVGTAMVPKVVSNMLCCVHAAAMGEVLMIAKRLGVDLEAFWHGVRCSVGNSFTWETAAPDVFNGHYHQMFPLDLQVKDIHLAYELAKEAKVPTDVLGATQQVFQRALYQFGPEAGCYSTPALLEVALKENLRVEGFKDWTYDLVVVDGAMQVRHKGIKLPESSSKPKQT